MTGQVTIVTLTKYSVHYRANGNYSYNPHSAFH